MDGWEIVAGTDGYTTGIYKMKGGLIHKAVRVELDTTP
jgi:hypothetical protein